MLRLLLRPRESFGGVSPGAATAQVLARADRSTGAPGWRAQLQRNFQLVPSLLPVAPLTRQLDCGDASLDQWLRADPAHVRADMSTARLMACGELGLDAAEAAQLLRPLKPLFGDSGFPISAPVPQRWYLQVPKNAQLPAFADPHEAMGAPLDQYLPEGDAGRRWRHLLNEAQVILHNHPLNQERVAQGRLPVNSLWFWGGGALPDSVRAPYAAVHSGDLLLRALAEAACISVHEPAPRFAADAGEALLDLRDLVDAAALEREWLAPALQAGVELQLDFGDGTLVHWQRAHRWRLWRRPRRSFD